MIRAEQWSPAFPSEIRPLFEARGLGLVGVAPAEADPNEEARYRQCLAEGRAGGMEWLARHAPLKFAPDRLLPGCRSILVAALPYYRPSSQQGGGGEGRADAPRGRIARYAWGRDYHKSLGGRLRAVARDLQRMWPGERFRAFTDSTPLAETFYAERAGIGFRGRNTLLINGVYGSWFLVGEILSTLEFPPSTEAGRPRSDCPGGCRRCLGVCPTGALAEPYRLDASRCISYLTIEHRGSIPLELRPKIGSWLFGCDLCQEVCPLAARPRPTNVEDFLRSRAGEAQSLERILRLADQAQVVEAFAGSPLVRAGRSRLVRNACVVAANLGSVELVPLLRDLAHDADAVVAEHAQWALAVLEGRRQRSQRRAAHPSITPQPRQTSPS